MLVYSYISRAAVPAKSPLSSSIPAGASSKVY